MGVPGLDALNKGGNVLADPISCASAGNCAATGFYVDNHSHTQGFVTSERKGHWGKAIEIPGLGALNKSGLLTAISVSCGSAGSCSAGGNYQDGSGHFQAFVANENNGIWGKAIEVPGSKTLNKGGFAVVNSLSCSPGRNCVAGGSYNVRQTVTQGFVVSERNGHWGKATPVPGLKELNVGEFAEVDTMSCGSAGNCSAGGDYRLDSNASQEGFVVSEKNGTWGNAIDVPGLSALATGGYSLVESVSCASAGNCSAGGAYSDDRATATGSAFVVSEKNGTWGNASGVPGLPRLNVGKGAGVGSVSCASPGNCAALGDYQSSSAFTIQGFVVSEKNGTWGKAIPIPHLATLNKGQSAFVVNVSCGAVGNCVAGGDYLDAPDGRDHAFVVSQTEGVWGKAMPLSGFKALNARFSGLGGISCPSPGHCAAAGWYGLRVVHTQGFVVAQK
jgi:hypothetical protein